MRVMLWGLMLGISMLSCRQGVQGDVFRVAVAANARYAVSELAEVFEQTSGVAVEVVVSSSGKLTAQIEQGAPYHLFFSADMKYPGYLQERGLTAGPVIPYAGGQIVWWTLKDTLECTEGEGRVPVGSGKIAIAHPELAPYGAAAQSYLESIGVWEKLLPRLVYGESISQVNQYILAGAASVGLTARSVVLAPELKGRGFWMEIPATNYPPIQQGVVMTVAGKEKWSRECRAFLDLLHSARGQGILESYGYLIPAERD
jgi:molybdate transport system substrate-binding protein